jgi:AraC-like DNA-binding protein
MSEIGIDAAALKRKLKLDLDHPPRPPRGFVYALWDAAVALSGESGIGIRIAERSRVEDWALLGGMTASSATLGDAMIAMTRMVPIFTTAVRVSFHVEADRCTWTLDAVRPDLVHPEHVELLVTSAIVLARHAVGEAVPLDDVFFAHEAPKDLRHHRRAFGVTPTFKAPGSGCTFESRQLALPLVTRDAQTHAELSVRVERLLEHASDPDDLRHRVREAIAVELRHGEPTAERVAMRLDLHPKALTRGLAALGTSYREVRDGLRYALAVRYLRRSHLGIEEIALRLGYSEASAFHRAFRRWSGRSPLDFRRVPRGRGDG